MRMVTRTTSLLTGDRSPMENRHRRRRVVSIRVQKAKGKVSAPLLGAIASINSFRNVSSPSTKPRLNGFHSSGSCSHRRSSIRFSNSLRPGPLSLHAKKTSKNVLDTGSH